MEEGWEVSRKDNKNKEMLCGREVMSKLVVVLYFNFWWPLVEVAEEVEEDLR